MDNIVQRRGRSHGRGIPDVAVWPIEDRRPCEDRDSPGRNLGTAAEIRASELDHRRLRLRPYRCTTIIVENSSENRREAILCVSMLDEGHQSDMPASNLKELIAWLKANPNNATAGTIGVGSGTQLCLIDFQNNTGTSFQLVPYRGAAPIMQDLI